MKKKTSRTIITSAVSVLVLLFAASPCYAWYSSEVHYSDTTIWVKDVLDEEKQYASKDCMKTGHSLSFDEKGIIEGIAASDRDTDSGAYAKDKTLHLDRRIDLGLSEKNLDTRISNAQKYMKSSKESLKAMYQATTDRDKKKHLEAALDAVGHGLHALQDYYAHLDAGASSKDIGSHGMSGFNTTDAKGELYYIGKKQDNGEAPVLDDTTWDSIPSLEHPDAYLSAYYCFDAYGNYYHDLGDGVKYTSYVSEYSYPYSWVRVDKKNNCERWKKTQDASKTYIRDFISYDYKTGTDQESFNFEKYHAPQY